MIIKVDVFEAIYQDEEPGERYGGWEVIEWTFVTLDGKAKSGKKWSQHYSDEAGCIKEAARLNAMVDALQP